MCAPAARKITAPTCAAAPPCPAHPTGHFQWLSFLAFAGSVVFEGVRVVMTEKLMGQVGACCCTAGCRAAWW